ncbi:MAG: ABC transporter permease, partial [Firmicutes bacterium]|nr:ABC transporter permease [Bacillota bacterium]
LAGVLVAGFITQDGIPVFWSIIYVLLIGAVLGAFTGLAVVYGGIAPFIATMAMQTIARGFTLLYTHSRSIFIKNEAFLWLGNDAILGIPIPIVIMILLTVLVQFVMRKTTFGRSLYAYGGNPNASYLAGIKNNIIVLKAYIYSAVFSSFAGIVLASRMAVGSPLVGPGMELNAIAAVVIGGASLAGGNGNAINTLIGALIIGAISNCLNIIGMQSYMQKVVIGIIILAAVLIRTLPEKFKK